MIVRVVAAFLDSGLRNAGTPLEIASTPDSAMAPDENARKRMRRLSPLIGPVRQLFDAGRGPAEARGGCRTNVRNRPTISSTPRAKM